MDTDFHFLQFERNSSLSLYYTKMKILQNFFAKKLVLSNNAC